MKIQPLSPAVVKKLRSGVILATVAHCVEELVLNSIDADAVCIAVNLNLPFYQIQVIDNGNGIEFDQLKVIGTRYTTSKCHTLDDLQNLRYGGFRGEALSSLKEVSSVLMIESRSASSSETFCKIFTQGIPTCPKKSINSRPSKGTTVSVYDFLYNMPVRKSCISDTLDIEECRKLLQGIALLHPNISFSLKNEATGEMCLQLKKCSSLYHSFIQIFGKHKGKNLKTVDFQADEYGVCGCISTDCHATKDLQFLYVNKRQVYRTKLHKLINNVLNRALNFKQKSKSDINNFISNNSSPLKTQAQYCTFVINISCPYDKYDVLFEPRKTMIEFSDWDKVLKIVEDSLIDFLKKQGIYCNTDSTESSSQNLIPEILGENGKFLNFDTHDCAQGLFSHVVKRLVNIADLQNDDKNAPLNENVINLAEQNFSLSSAPLSKNNNEQTSSDPNTSLTESDVDQHVKSSTSLSNDNSLVFLRTDDSAISLLDNLKASTTNNLFSSKDLLTSNSSNGFKTGIPCRSVFPSKSPVMLRIPIKSTLSDLSHSGNSNLLIKLKEKFQYSPKVLKGNSTKSLDIRKHVCKKLDKAGIKLSHVSKLPTINFSQNSPSLLEQEKNEPVLNETYNEQHENNPDMSMKSSSKITKDKSFQFPSVSKESSRIVSRFEFRKDPVPSTLQNLRKSHRLERKSIRKLLNGNSSNTFENHFSNMNNSHDISNAKKLKSYKLDISDAHINDLLQEDKMVKGKDYFSGDNSVQEVFDDSNCINKIFENATISGIFDNSSIKNIKSSTLNDLNHSTFSLETFNKASNKKEVIQSSCTFKEIDSCLDVDESHSESGNNLCDDYTSSNKTGPFSYQLSSDRSSKIIESVKDMDHYSSNIDCNSMEHSPNVNIEYEIPREKNGHINSVAEVYSKEFSSDLAAVADNLFNKDTSSFDSNNLKFENNSNLNDRSIIDVPREAVSMKTRTDTNGDHKRVFEVNTRSKEPIPFLPNMNKFHSLKHNDIAEITNSDAAHSVSSESYPFTDFLPSNDLCMEKNNFIENNTINSDSVGNNSRELSRVPYFSEMSYMDVDVSSNDKQIFNNQSLKAFENENQNIKTSDEIFDSLHIVNILHPQKGNDLSEIYNSCGDNFESYPFTESLPANDLCMRQSNSSEKNTLNSDIANNNSGELFVEPPFSEVLYMDVDAPSSDEQTFNNQVTRCSNNFGNSDNEASTEVSEPKENSVDDAENFLDAKVNSKVIKTISPGVLVDSNKKCSELNQNEENHENCIQINNRWTLHSEPETRRAIYIDSVTGNSTYKVPNETVKNNQNEISDNDNNIEFMLRKWNNPTFDIPYEVSCIADNRVSQNLPQMYTFLNSYRFARSTLNTLQVIGQVDCKFIACILCTFNENQKDKKLLALFDQHAVHERVRLEEIMEDLYEVQENGEKIMKTSSVYPPMKLSLDPEEIRLLQTYHGKLSQIGIHLTLDNESHICSVHSVPACLTDRESKELRRSRSDTALILQNSITEWLSSLVKTRSIPQILPKTLISVVNYQACRGAVKFGDPLSFGQCKDLLVSLSECKLPFQCAHGRPSVAPILDLNKIECFYKKKPPPQLQKLSSQIRKL